MDARRDAAPSRHRFGAFVFDAAARELRRDGVAVEMPVRVFECLEHLIAHRERAVGRDELLQAVFRRTDVSDGQLAQVILRARRCVDDDGHLQHAIRTVPRFGFRWVAATEVLSSDAVSATNTAPASTADNDARPAADTSAFHSLPLAGEGQLRAADTAPAKAGAGGPALGLDGDAAAAPATTRAAIANPPTSRARSMSIVAASLLVVAVPGAGIWWWKAARPPADPATNAAAASKNATLVLPAQIDANGDIAWARLGLMDFLAERLRLAGLSVPPSESTLALLGAGSAGSDRARLRDAAGAGLVIDSRVRRDGARWRVTLGAEGNGLRQRAEAVDADLLTAARQACDRLLAAMGRHAPAGTLRALDLEERLQRVKAALLANELDTARRILNAAPPSQLSQPQLKYRLAQIDYRAGDFGAAETALDALLAGPEAAADPLFRTRLLIYRGGARFRRNALFEAERDFDAALAAVQALDADLEHGSVLNGRATVRAVLGRDNDAIADFGAARAKLQRAGDRLGVARVDANLGALELNRGRPGPALDYLQGALATFEQWGAIAEQQVTRSALSATHLQRLDARAALAASDGAWRLLPRAADPTLRLAAHLDRANALIALGRFSEAKRLLDDPAIAATTTPPYEQRRAQTRVELAWRSGAPETAVAIADAALADWPRLPADDLRDWVRLRRAQAARAADPGSGPGRSLPHSTIGTVEPSAETTVPALLAEAVARGDGRDAEALLRDALALAERRGTPAGILEVATVFVPWLLRHDRRQEAAALVGRIAPWGQRSYDSALLQLQLAQALGDQALIVESRQALARLAGERPVPAMPTATDAAAVMRR
jgi:DNA-binding winged helix-turn-helix (wHTH) protein/tetratricopeptide (TPR) repeat protein